MQSAQYHLVTANFACMQREREKNSFLDYSLSLSIYIYGLSFMCKYYSYEEIYIYMGINAVILRGNIHTERQKFMCSESDE